jgi:hypothetical protein
MNSLLIGVRMELIIIVIACFIVLLAMAIDLASGLAKAKVRGEIRSSWGLKRSLIKFITYEGGMLISAGIDLLIYLCKVMALVHLEILEGIPIVTCMVGIFLLVVEWLSVREKADEKTKTEFSRVEKLAKTMVSRQELVDALTDALSQASKNRSKD